jgi:hypothetical protein
LHQTDGELGTLPTDSFTPHRSVVEYQLVHRGLFPFCGPTLVCHSDLSLGNQGAIHEPWYLNASCKKLFAQRRLDLSFLGKRTSIVYIPKCYNIKGI